jgi:serine/threonine protein kinase
MESIAGKYQVIRELGDGGYGKVYLCKHVDLGLEYAIKVLSKELSEDTQFIDLFKREAEILQKFSHPCSVQLRDFGRLEDGRYYMAQDFAPGVTLTDLLAQTGHMSPISALEIIEQLLDALRAAHDFGIIHQDIKPDNLMIESVRDGKFIVKVLDFGIAKLKNDHLALQAAPSSDENTLPPIQGTPEYMAPEQSAGEISADHRTDIYAVGIVLFEMLEGVVPFKAESIMETLLQHLLQPLPPFTPLRGIPEHLRAVVEKSLSKDPEKRFSSADEFQAAVHEARIRVEREGITVPLADPGAMEKQFEDSIRRLAEKKKQTRTKVLCLDDNEMILNILKHLLEREGYEVITTQNPETIHEHLFKNDVKLLISDVEMPGLPGSTVCKMLKASIENLKIVLFSNIPERDLMKISAASHADDWISKNARPEEWIKKVRAVLAE